MPSVDWMAFTTPCGKNRSPEAGSRRVSAHPLQGGWRSRWLALVWVCFGLLAPAWAGGALPLALERQPDGLYLSARVALALPPVLEDALLRGVPLHFVWQADVRRSRWYWVDRQVSSATRVVRLVYQPLTRRWRVSMGSGPVGEGGLNNALHQNLETLDAALAVVKGVTRWRVAAESDLAANDKLDVQFRLDTGMLPRPFLIGETPGDWALEFQQTQAVPAKVGDASPPPSE